MSVQHCGTGHNVTLMGVPHVQLMRHMRDTSKPHPGCPACTDVSRLINTGYAGHVILVMTILWFRLDGWPVVCQRMRDIVTQRLYDDSALVEK